MEPVTLQSPVYEKENSWVGGRSQISRTGGGRDIFMLFNDKEYYEFEAFSLKTESCQDANFVITGGTTGCD